MKAAELMIGDYVQLRDAIKVRYNKVTAIRDDGNDQRFVRTIESDVFICEENCLPIPLTDEILRKNGIELVEVGDNGISTPPKNRNRYEKWFIHTTFRDTYLWRDRLADYWHLQDMNAFWINNVHELQHALRMAKIDMEIVL